MSESGRLTAVQGPMSGHRRDVLLIKPAGAAFSSFPPLNLMMLAASLKEAGYSVSVLDLGYREDRDELDGLNPGMAPLLFGVTATTPEFIGAVRLVGMLKGRFPSVPVVVGGVHMSALGVDAMNESGADFGVVGEGENPLCELLEALQNDSVRLAGIPGLLYRDENGIVAGPAGPAISVDVDSCPPADWDLVRAERYFSKPWGIVQKGSRTGFIVTSRGCSCRCASCSSGCTTGSLFRGRSPLAVVDEISELNRRHGVNEILIAEDNFTRDRDRAATICDEIMRRGLRISWRTPNGVPLDTIDAELAVLMKKSGCYLTGFSTECGGGDPDLLVEKVAVCRSVGMMTFCSFIVGRPGETIESARGVTRLAVRSGVDIAHFGIWAPYPGSDEFSMYSDHPGMRDWDRYLLFEALPVSGLSPDEARSVMRGAYLSFYLRPARARLYVGMLSPSRIAWALRAFRAYAG